MRDPKTMNDDGLAAEIENAEVRLTAAVRDARDAIVRRSEAALHLVRLRAEQRERRGQPYVIVEVTREAR